MDPLEKLNIFVRNMREEGDSDLRTIIWAINVLQNDPKVDINDKDR